MPRFAIAIALLSLVLTAAAVNPDAVTPDGGRYYGPLVNGKLQGKGRIEWDSGAWYEGEFANGLMSGRGELHFPDGRVYRGELQRGRLEGKGRLEMPQGDVYEGEFRKDRLNGKGSYRPAGGSGGYEGEFRDYRFHGHGRYDDGHGTVWEGTFVNGQLDGPGKSTDLRGAYEGEFKQWSFHGKGVLKLRNGDVYEGNFANGLYDGEGTLTYAQPKADGRKKDSGPWRYGTLVNDPEQTRTQASVEQALYSQRRLLDKALAALQPRVPGRINMYLLAVAGDGSQEVFRREVEYVQKEFAARFGTAGRTVALVNSRNTIATAPMATVTSISEALKAIAARMDRQEDILFLFMTSHGSPQHEFYLGENGMQLAGLRAPVLAQLIKESGIRWKVVLVSACYSGGFIDPLQDGRTLVIAAARKDRRSFGCADENDFTYFGRAYFKESLPKAGSFQDAFQHAAALVRQWEGKNASDPALYGSKAKTHPEEIQSFPQISSSPEIDARLKRWWAQSAR